MNKDDVGNEVATLELMEPLHGNKTDRRDGNGTDRRHGNGTDRRDGNGTDRRHGNETEDRAGIKQNSWLISAH